MKRVVLVLLAVVSLAAGCSDDSQTTTPSTTTATTSETFASSLSVMGSSFYSFTVSQSGTANIMLASLTPSAGGQPLATVVGVGLGAPVGTGCSVTTSINIAPALTAQLNSEVTPAIYCVSIFDVGNLTEAVDFAIRIVHP